MNEEDRFRAASRLLDDPLVREIFESIEADAVNSLLDTYEDKARVELIAEIRTIRALRDRLTGIRDTHAEDQRNPTVV
jgi:hypothetical protein